MRNCLLQAISPFLNVFHSYISLVRQNETLCGNGLTQKDLDKFRGSFEYIEGVTHTMQRNQGSLSKILVLESVFCCIKLFSFYFDVSDVYK